MNARLENSFQAFADILIVFDVHGRIVEYKGTASSRYPVLEDVVGKLPGQIFPAAEAAKIEKALLQVRKYGDVAMFQCSLFMGEAELWFDARLTHLSDTHFILTARDITIWHETEIRLNRKMQQLSALRSLDLAIASGLDLNLLLSMFLDQVTALLNADACAVLLLNPRTNLLEFEAGRGFRSNALRYTRLTMGESFAGKVALERTMMHIPDFSKHRTGFDRSPQFEQEKFVSYYGAPLIAKGRVLGVLEIFRRSFLKPDTDWLNFLKMLAGQAAIAIDNATMFKDLQISNMELSMAYDATIEGLSRALDLRDKETEEHTRRVTDMAMKMAERMGITDAERVHVRRGAILHDIGKVGIPDQILFKPGPLAEEEWKIMRGHPNIAVDLLSPVRYLAPALDIPHWHHERWDGTGYPDRLRGEEIPFAARLFAFADVYDALTSDRPYRRAWRKQQALEYIREQSGQHFDPNMVPVFLDLVNGLSD